MSSLRSHLARVLARLAQSLNPTCAGSQQTTGNLECRRAGCGRLPVEIAVVWPGTETTEQAQYQVAGKPLRPE